MAHWIRYPSLSLSGLFDCQAVTLECSGLDPVARPGITRVRIGIRLNGFFLFDMPTQTNTRSNQSGPTPIQLINWLDFSRIWTFLIATSTSCIVNHVLILLSVMCLIVRWH